MKNSKLTLTSLFLTMGFTAFSQSGVTSLDTNNLNRLGTNSVYIGVLTGSNSTGIFNTFTGGISGLANTTGNNNTFTGGISGLSNTTGSNNVFTGFNAGRNNTNGTGNVFTGFEAGFANTSGFSNVFTGNNAGRNNTTGNFNIFTGFEAGLNSTTGSENIFTGFNAGRSNTTGSDNIFTGHLTARQNTTGSENIIMGRDSGGENTTGSFNVFMGSAAGGLNKTGNNTIAIGNRAGFRSGFNEGGGDNNVFIGHYAGQNERGSSKLYIDDSDAADLSDADTPLIYGDFEENQLVFHGQVSTGIGNTVFPTEIGGVDVSEYTLFVAGGLLSEEVRINTDWADYVFNDSYKLKSLNEVEEFINENGHLPNVPSAEEVEASGIEMGEITKIQQEKIEELTLYIIEQNKRIEALEAKMSIK